MAMVCDLAMVVQLEEYRKHYGDSYEVRRLCLCTA